MLFRNILHDPFVFPAPILRYTGQQLAFWLKEHTGWICRARDCAVAARPRFATEPGADAGFLAGVFLGFFSIHF